MSRITILWYSSIMPADKPRFAIYIYDYLDFYFLLFPCFYFFQYRIQICKLYSIKLQNVEHFIMIKWNKFGKWLNELWTWTWITIKLWCNLNDLVNRFRNLFRNLICVHIRNEIEFDCKNSINCAKTFLSVFFFYYCQEKQLSN